jgi:hypothetical protein
MLIPYRTLIDLPFLRKLAYNTSYNYGKLQEVAFANELLPARTAKSYDTGRSWANAYIQMILLISSTSGLSYPEDVSKAKLFWGEGDGLVYAQMTSEYQTFLGLHYKYLSTGGFSLYNASVTSHYRLTGSIIKLRLVTGIEVTG